MLATLLPTPDLPYACKVLIVGAGEREKGNVLLHDTKTPDDVSTTAAVVQAQIH